MSVLEDRDKRRLLERGLTCSRFDCTSRATTWDDDPLCASCAGYDWEAQLDVLRDERDEARALVRRWAEWATDDVPENVAGIIVAGADAIARWDAKAKR